MSDFYQLSEEHMAVREAVRDLCDAKIAPFAAEVDAEARYPHEAAAALLASDFHAPHVPEEYGGAGADALATVIIIEEVARACVSSSVDPCGEQVGLAPDPDQRKPGAQGEAYLHQTCRPVRAVFLLPVGARCGHGCGWDEDHARFATAMTGSSMASSVGSPTLGRASSTQ
ncbi:MAG: acyl-CoA dehydrogenase family protein [Marmoricola sp.]